MRLSPVLDLKPPPSETSLEVLDGLSRTPKAIPSKYLYDRRGSRLFELITQLPEYYLTRTEMQILRTNAADIARCVGASRRLIEFGSGSSAKTRLLLDPLRPVGYVPVDISRQRLAASVVALHDEFEELPIVPVCADYSRPFVLPAAAIEGARTAFFPGSSIGNFEEGDAIDFLRVVREVVGSDGQLLIGVDLKKDPATIVRAYDDAQGVTAAFTQNVLHHLNELLGAEFDVDAFRHRARYNAKLGRVEVHLVCESDQSVEICGQHICIRNGEAIHVENCYKYDLAAIRQPCTAQRLRTTVQLARFERLVCSFALRDCRMNAPSILSALRRPGGDACDSRRALCHPGVVDPTATTSHACSRVPLPQVRRGAYRRAVPVLATTFKMTPTCSRYGITARVMFEYSHERPRDACTARPIPDRHRSPRGMSRPDCDHETPLGLAPAFSTRDFVI